MRASGTSRLQLLRDDLDTMHAVMHEEHLPAPVDLAQNRLADQVFVVFANGCADGQALLRRRLDHAHVAHVDQRHVQRARDGRGRHGQHIYLVAQSA